MKLEKNFFDLKIAFKDFDYFSKKIFLNLSLMALPQIILNKIFQEQEYNLYILTP